MAGNLKPVNAGPEVQVHVIAANLYQSQGGTGLFDGVLNKASNTNVGYWHPSANNLEIEFDVPVNIWTLGSYTSSTSNYSDPLTVQKWNGTQYVDYGVMPKTSTDSTWGKDMSNMPAGRYRFFMASNYSARYDGEWYVELAEVKPTAPINLIAVPGSFQVALTWSAVAGASSYQVKRSITAGGPYISIASNVQGTSYTDTSTLNGTTYYYVVTAVNTAGESVNSNEASATPAAPGQGILRVVMSDSSERKFQLSSSEIDSFAAWATRQTGTGTTAYALNGSIGQQCNKEYLMFDKIISFEVTALK